MDTKVFYVAIVSIAIGGLMWQLGGFADLFAGTAPGDQLDSASDVSDRANDSEINDNFTGDASADDGSLVGLIISGGALFFDTLKLVLFLPGELAAMGLPRWAADPIGDLSAIFISIGAVQAVIGRVYR